MRRLPSRRLLVRAAPAVILLLLSGRAFAQPIQEKGKHLIDEAVEALGGAGFLSLKNYVEKGRAYSFFRERLSGLSKATFYFRYLTAPAPPNIDELYVRERQAFGNEEAWAILFDEKDGWEITFRGARPLKTDLVDRHRESTQRNIFYILLRRLGEEGLIFEYRGAEVVDNRPTEKIGITDAKNRVITVFFSTSTKLPFRQEFDRRDEYRIPHRETTVFDKYRDVGGGVMLPFVTQRYRDGERIYAMFAESVLINQDLTDEKFTLPGRVKMLERQK
ncbi:MAG: hypothetical protein KIT09_22495 [Bryobacteraceae bacterium]|nr:hypothetical protein [Bryobacteraceae bacterium]